jgi:hypothetical protein
MAMQGIAPDRLDGCEDELIDVVRIRLSNRARATTLLSEFNSADQVIANWSSDPGCNPVEFEITFFDGHVVRGCYEFFSSGKTRHAFSRHVRRLLRPPALEQAQANAARDLSRYAAPA